jgi:hypothetical protein
VSHSTCLTACVQGSQTDVARIPCHHEHLTQPERTKKPPHAAGGSACVGIDEQVAEMSPVRGGRQYILQHSPQRAGVTSVGIRTLPSASKSVAGLISRTPGPQLPAPANVASARKSPAVKPQPNAAQRAEHAAAGLPPKEGAEAAAWLSIARDDAKMLSGVLPHVSVNLADDDGETLLLCACRCASAALGLQSSHDAASPNCRCSSPACALVLIERGCDCDARDEDGLTALAWAW